MEKLGDAGLGTKRKEAMNIATENVKAFIKESEENLHLVESTDPKFDSFLDFNNNDAKKAYVATVNQTVNNLLSAKDSSAKSKALRDALNAKYEGKNSSKAYRNLYKGLSREGVLLGNLLDHLEDEDKRQNLIMILSSFMHTKVDGSTLVKVQETIEKMKVTELPLPLQAGDYTMMISQLFPSIKSIVEAVKSSSSASGSGRKMDMAALVQFQKDIMKSVGDRSYQTVGDKIVVGIVYSLLTTVVEIDKAYQLSPEYKEAEPGHLYDEFFTFVLDNEKGLVYVDRMLTYLEAISYIYDVKLDMAGLVSGLV